VSCLDVFHNHLLPFLIHSFFTSSFFLCTLTFIPQCFTQCYNNLAYLHTMPINSLASLYIFKTRKWDMNNLFSHIGEVIIYIFYGKGYLLDIIWNIFDWNWKKLKIKKNDHINLKPPNLYLSKLQNIHFFFSISYIAYIYLYVIWKKMEMTSLILHMQIHENFKFCPLKAKKKKRKTKDKDHQKKIPSLEGFIFLVS
jgi:hypothetical protein